MTSASYNFGRRRIWQGLTMILLVSTLGLAAQKPPKAEQVLADAESKATEQHKTIFLVFGASWCEPCHQLDRFLEAPEIHPLLDKYFVFAKLAVAEEFGNNPKLNSPGSDKLMARLGGTIGGTGGLPYFVFLDAKGETIINSKRPVRGQQDGADIGYPSEPEEIDWFVSMLKKGAPSLTTEEARIVENWLRRAAGS